MSTSRLPSSQSCSSQSSIPRYLFRVWSPNSDGHNSEAGFRSLGNTKYPNGQRYLASLEPGKAKDMIVYHAQWKSKTLCHSDVLISFTSSLLFAVQHANRKINTSFASSPDTPKNSFLTVVDTHLLGQTFLKTTNLIGQYGLTGDDLAPFERPQHEQEYLAEWEVNLQAVTNSSCTVNFGLLIERGLTKVVPQLQKDYQRRYGLHESLQGFLSHVRAQRYRVPARISFEELTAIGGLAACFSGRWRQIMHLWCIALTQRNADDPALIEIVKRNWVADEDIFKGFYKAFVPKHAVVIEEQEFTKIMTLAAAYAYARQADDGLLPEWTPQPTVAAGNQEKSVQSYLPPPKILSAAALYRMETQQKITKSGFKTLAEISREMEERGI